MPVVTPYTKRYSDTVLGAWGLKDARLSPGGGGIYAGGSNSRIGRVSSRNELLNHNNRPTGLYISRSHVPTLLDPPHMKIEDYGGYDTGMHISTRSTSFALSPL